MQPSPASVPDSDQYPNPLAEFKDKVVVVLGGASGIGLETAKSYWEQGARVYVVGLMPVPPSVSASGAEARRAYIESAAKDLQGAMRETTGPVRHQVQFVECDVSREAAPEQASVTGDKLFVQQSLREIAEKHGHIDVIADTIGWRPQVASNDLTPGLLQKVMAVNAGYLPFLFNEQFIAPLMKNSEAGGRILVVGSTLPNGNTDPAAGPYASAKSARISHAGTAAAALGKHGIGVVILSPGHVDNEAERAILGVEKAMQVEASAIARRHVHASLTGPEVARAILLHTTRDAMHYSGQNVILGAAGSKIMPILTLNGEEQLEASAQTSRDFMAAAVQMMDRANGRISTLAADNGALTLQNTELQKQLDEMRKTVEGLAIVIAESGLANQIDASRHGIQAVRSVQRITDRHRHTWAETPAGSA